jgi:hypothetical protein
VVLLFRSPDQPITDHPIKLPATMPQVRHQNNKTKD